MIIRYEGATKVADVTSTQLTATDVLDLIYPIGSIAIGAKPNIGTWEQIQGKFLWASNTAHPVGDTGGSETVTLTVNQIPEHRHRTPSRIFTGADSNRTQGYVVDDGTNFVYYDANRTSTGYTGGGQAHDNMPPYLSVNMWKRTA